MLMQLWMLQFQRDEINLFVHLLTNKNISLLMRRKLFRGYAHSHMSDDIET